MFNKNIHTLKLGTNVCMNALSLTLMWFLVTMLLGGDGGMVLSVVLTLLPHDRGKESAMSFFLFGSSSGGKITGNYNGNTKCSCQIILVIFFGCLPQLKSKFPLVRYLIFHVNPPVTVVASSGRVF